MITKKIFLTTLLSSLILAQTINAGAPGEITLSPQEIEELQALEKAVADERARMSPEERAKFDKDVQELQAKLERMPPEELEDFVNRNIFGYSSQTSAPGEQPAPTTPSIPQPTPPAKEALEIKQPTVPQDKVDALLKAITTIIASTTSFMAKIDIMPEFVAKFKKWTEQGKLRNWQPGMSWDSIKKQINDLLQDLHKIKEQDKKTKDYKYINYAAEDENVVKSLTALARNIENEEKTIEVDQFGLEPVSRTSRQHIRNVISSFLEAFNIDNIFTLLKNVRDKFEPVAQTYRETELAATKKAGEESKVPRRAQPSVTAGRPEEPYYPGYATSPSSGYYGGGAPTYGGHGYGTEGGPTSGAMRSFDDKGGQGGGRGSESGKPGASSTSDKDKDKDKGKSPDKPHDDGDKKPSTKEIAGKRSVDKFDANLTAAVEALTESPLSKISQYMSGKGEPDKNIVASNLPTAVKKFNAAAENLKTLKNRFKDLKDAQKNEYKALIKVSYEEHQSTIDDVLKQIRDIRANEGRYDKKMSDAFLHGEYYTLANLQAAMENMQNSYRDLVGK